ncbi:MAG: hypothetical protein HXY46_06395 [Syntrophaceae bacterium]|nr:hypothetical protein [Syntrophaceae bacterium]
MNGNLNASMIQVVTLLEESGKEAINRAARGTFSNTPGFKVTSILKGDFIDKHLSNGVRTFVSKFIQIFLQIFYGTEKKNQQIGEMVSPPIRVPLLTALEQLRVVNKTVIFSEKNMQFRIGRLENALYSLDQARSLASEGFEIALVDILRGLCSFEIPGGKSEAIVHLRGFKIWARKEVGRLVSMRKEKKRKAERVNVEIEELKHLTRTKKSDPSLYLALERAQDSAQCLRAEIDEITGLISKILDNIFYTTALLEVAKKMRDE